MFPVHQVMQFSQGLSSASKSPSLSCSDPQEQALAITEPGTAITPHRDTSAAQREHPRVVLALGTAVAGQAHPSASLRLE